MNRKELDKEIDWFLAECLRRGFPINNHSLIEAYPGDSSTSYFLQLESDMINDDECFEAIEEFTDIMFDVMSFEARKKIFAIRIATAQWLNVEREIS